MSSKSQDLFVCESEVWTKTENNRRAETKITFKNPVPEVM
jgi:hypothetical protein